MRRLTPVQLTLLALLAASSCAVFAVLGLLLSAAVLNPPPQVVALLAVPTLTASFTPLPVTATPSPTDTPVSTDTLTPTLTPTATPTLTASPTPTDTPSLTPTSTHTATPTRTPTPTPLWATAPPMPWLTATPLPSGVRPPPSLDDFWDGRAAWQLDVFDVGLPIGESDTLIGPDGQLWSYLHASTDSRGIVDQWEAAVPFPGCVTLWQSSDRGQRFHLFSSHCLIACRTFPCGAVLDDIDQQQYPRVARAADGTWVMVYEWHAQIYLRLSADGLNWGRSRRVPGTGVWFTTTPSGYAACQGHYRVNPHPFVPAASDYDCLSGAPPGLYIDGDQMYVFVGMGQNPGHLGCYTGPVAGGAAGLAPCAANPLLTGADSYGPAEAQGAAGNAYFDFRTLSSADVVRVGERYYLTYEGVRGPGPSGGGDSQFNLGLARSQGPALDGPWEKYGGNPVLGDVPGNVGLGHADLLVLDGVTYLYTATSGRTRGRYMLAWP
jgi:hypothetical protein